MSGPIRTCAGCGRKAPKAELVRFVAREGSLAHDSLGEGRGAYTCTSLACFERAQASRAFNRILKTSVRVDPAQARIYTDTNG